VPQNTRHEIYETSKKHEISRDTRRDAPLLGM